MRYEGNTNSSDREHELDLRPEDTEGMYVVTGLTARLLDLRDQLDGYAQAGGRSTELAYGTQQGDLDGLLGYLSTGGEGVISDAPVVHYDDAREADLARRLGVEGINLPDIRLEGDA
ncbi:MAG TPA: hypothetical protein VJP80_04200 [Candidatus Saccharimonadales bacterium]|nr:hypothetical protein [Candidatus Saccharimonadales bacterium]